MFYLILVSLIWAFSFGLIKHFLGNLDSSLVAFLRIFISLLVFLPFLSLKQLSVKKVFLPLFFIGIIQYGIMYLCYITAFSFLKSYQIAVFTILTPLYVVILNDILEKRFHPHFLLSALGAVAGCLVITYRDIGLEEFSAGFLLVQGSNLSFAAGQMFYKKLMEKNREVKDFSIFWILYLGGSAITLFSVLVNTDFARIALTFPQVLVLLYLGLIASGAAFFLWNRGVKIVNAGQLAVMNNLKIPLGVAASVILFKESISFLSLLIGGAILILFLIPSLKK